MYGGGGRGFISTSATLTRHSSCRTNDRSSASGSPSFSGVNTILSRIFGNGPPPKAAHGPVRPPSDDTVTFKVPALPRKQQPQQQQQQPASTSAKLSKTSSVMFSQDVGATAVANPKEIAASHAERPSERKVQREGGGSDAIVP